MLEPDDWKWLHDRRRLFASYPKHAAFLDRVLAVLYAHEAPSNPVLVVQEGDLEWKASQGGYLREMIVYEVSDYNGGDPVLELAERREGGFDLVLSKGGDDITLQKISPLMLSKIGGILTAASGLSPRQTAGAGDQDLRCFECGETANFTGPICLTCNPELEGRS